MSTAISLSNATTNANKVIDDAPIFPLTADSPMPAIVNPTSILPMTLRPSTISLHFIPIKPLMAFESINSPPDNAIIFMANPAILTSPALFPNLDNAICAMTSTEIIPPTATADFQASFQSN